MFLTRQLWLRCGCFHNGRVSDVSEDSDQNEPPSKEVHIQSNDQGSETSKRHHQDEPRCLQKSWPRRLHLHAEWSGTSVEDTDEKFNTCLTSTPPIPSHVFSKPPKKTDTSPNSYNHGRQLCPDRGDRRWDPISHPVSDRWLGCQKSRKKHQRRPPQPVTCLPILSLPRTHIAPRSTTQHKTRTIISNARIPRSRWRARTRRPKHPPLRRKCQQFRQRQRNRKWSPTLSIILPPGRSRPSSSLRKRKIHQRSRHTSPVRRLRPSTTAVNEPPSRAPATISSLYGRHLPPICRIKRVRKLPKDVPGESTWASWRADAV